MVVSKRTSVSVTVLTATQRFLSVREDSLQPVVEQSAPPVTGRQDHLTDTPGLTNTSANERPPAGLGESLPPAGAPVKKQPEKRPRTIPAPKGYGRVNLENQIIQLCDEIYGDVDADLQDGSSESEAEKALWNHANATTWFGRQYPEEIRNLIIAHPEIKDVLSLERNDATRAGGEDAYAAMGEDRYLAALQSLIGNRTNRVERAKKHLPGAHPLGEWLVAVHDNLLPARERGKMELRDPKQMTLGTKFTYQGEEFEVIEDPDTALSNARTQGSGVGSAPTA